MKKQQVHNVILLDESGSMMSIKHRILDGFNELAQNMQGIEKEFPNQEHFISFISFNGLGQKILHFIDPVSKLKQLNDELYQPNGSTPLYDAMGFAINKMDQYLKNGIENYHVLVTILTDGEENASKEYNGKQIKALIKQMKLNNWTFTYIGADHDVEKFAQNLDINNIMRFEKNGGDIKKMFNREFSSRKLYSMKIDEGKDVQEGFYDETNEK